MKPRGSYITHTVKFVGLGVGHVKLAGGHAKTLAKRQFTVMEKVTWDHSQMGREGPVHTES